MDGHFFQRPLPSVRAAAIAQGPMGLIPDDSIAEIRERADIVAIIGRHIELKKAGRNHKGLCPFHQEKSPSFNVNGDKGFYYCFGCQKKGDVFSFVMEYEGRSFTEAAESLAAQLGILIPETSESQRGMSAVRRGEKSQMFELNKLAMEFYRDQLLGPNGAAARSYLQERGIGAEQSEAFVLGYAPDDWRTLADFLHARGGDLRLAEQVGLLVKQQKSSGYYDRFRDRLMCPIAQTSGDISGFSGRRLAKEETDKSGAKYINSPESAVYKKSKLLFGIYQAREAFRTAGHAILVEGNFDVIRLHEHGFQQAVAPLGTALTDAQALRLKRLTQQVYLLYDGDNAGRAATLKGLQTLLSQGVSVKIARLPSGEDPDSLIGQGGASALSLVLKRAQPAVEYFVHEVWVRADRSAAGRAATLQEAAQVFKNISDPTQRDFAIGTFATALGVAEGTLRQGLRRAFQNSRQKSQRQSADQTPEISQPKAPQKPPPGSQLDIICILAEYPELLSVAETGDAMSVLSDTRLQDMYRAALSGQPMLSATDDPHIAKALLSGAFSGVSNPAECLESAIVTLRGNQTKGRLGALQLQAEEAGRRGDSELERQLIREILLVRKQQT